MLRRSHKKSRAGCLNCKRRHVKCDEVRPVCHLCVVSEQRCSYPSPTPTPNNFATSDPNPQSRSRSPVSTSSLTESGRPYPDGLFASRPPDLNLNPTIGPNGNDELKKDLEAPVNLAQMELLAHITLSRDMFNLADHYQPTATLAAGLEIALTNTYLLYEALAFSARHLAYIHPNKSISYMHQAVNLQTRALALFNEAFPPGNEVQVTRENCVTVLLFAAVLGHHLLADTLAARNFSGLSAFTAHYVQCIETHRGIYTITTSALPLLMESELEPILSLSLNHTSSAPRGSHCQQLTTLVDSLGTLTGEQKEACHLVIRYLQVGFDAALADLPEGSQPVNRFQMVFKWTMLVPPLFTALLAAQRPEALVVVSYYAVLLHYGRSMWQIGDAGVHTLNFIVDNIGAEWQQWLEYPRRMVADSGL